MTQPPGRLHIGKNLPNSLQTRLSRKEILACDVITSYHGDQHCVDWVKMFILTSSCLHTAVTMGTQVVAKIVFELED